MIIVIVYVITARKRSLGQGNMFTGVCLPTGGVPGPGVGDWGCSGGCLLPGGTWSRRVHAPRGGAWSGGSAPGGGLLPVGTPWDGYCCVRYASYWNAFLLHKSQPKSEASCVAPLKLELLRDPVK